MYFPVMKVFSKIGLVLVTHPSLSPVAETVLRDNIVHSSEAVLHVQGWHVRRHLSKTVHVESSFVVHLVFALADVGHVHLAEFGF